MLLLTVVAGPTREYLTRYPKDREAMVALTDGTEVVRMLEKAIGNPDRYRRVIISSPFLDDAGAGLLSRLFAATQNGPLVTLLTRPEVASRYAAVLNQRGRNVELLVPPALHAKCYVLIGRVASNSEAIVTSSNLTAAGTGRNWEVGVALRGDSQPLIASLSALLIGSSRRRGEGKNGNCENGRSFVFAARIQ